MVADDDDDIIQLERRKYNYEKVIVLVNKKIPCISYAKKNGLRFIFHCFQCPQPCQHRQRHLKVRKIEIFIKQKLRSDDDDILNWGISS